jgi:hypothetical protein
LIVCFIIGIGIEMVLGRAGEMAHVALLKAPLAFGAVFFSPAIANVILSFDTLARDSFAHSAGNNASQFFNKLVDISGNVSALGLPIFLTIIIFLLFSLGMFGLWLLMAVREGSVYVIMAFIPVTLGLMVLPNGHKWAKMIWTTLVVVIFVDTIVAVIWSIGASMLNNANFDDKLGLLLAALGIMFVSFYAPWHMLKFIPGVAAHIGGSLAVREKFGRTAPVTMLRRGASKARSKMGEAAKWTAAAVSGGAAAGAAGASAGSASSAGASGGGASGGRASGGRGAAVMNFGGSKNPGGSSSRQSPASAPGSATATAPVPEAPPSTRSPRRRPGASPPR